MPLYDKIGKDYAVKRQTEPRIASLINEQLEGATRILNIGAGTGSYEPTGVDLVALEPSAEMIGQRSADAYPAVQGSAEYLPFEDNSFSHAMTVLSMHHWSDKPKAFHEINRVTSDRFVAISWNPEATTFWLTRDYFPEIMEEDVNIFPKMDVFDQYFDEVKVQPIPIPEDCIDGFLSAFWKRPEAYLSSLVRQSISSFAKMKDASKGLQKLKDDLESGVWHERNKDTLKLTELDVGYVLISAKIKR